MQYLIDRLSEPSTWRGLIALVTALGVQLSPDFQAAIISAGLACIGLVNVVIKEHKS